METQYNDLYRPFCLAHFAFPKALPRVSESPLSNNTNRSNQPFRAADNPAKPPEQALPASVTLVGAGPGDPQLLTLRGRDSLKNAEVVLYDGLVNPSLLLHAPPAALRINVGKHGSSRIWKQSEIHAEMLKHYRAGKRVVRLKGGDPAVFARTAEELEFLAQHDIAAEIVPGITAALAVPAYTGIPLTHRDHASAVALITGQQAEDATELDWEALARFPGTLVLYMGVTTAGSWSQQLLRAGKEPSTPTALVRRVSWPDQQIIRTTLADVAAELTPSHRLRPPVLVIVGPVAMHADPTPQILPHLQPAPQTSLPLTGRTILVTRADNEADRLTHELTQRGAQVIHQPAISITPCADRSPLDHAIQACSNYQWIVFTSAHGVEQFARRLQELQLDARQLAGIRLAAVGPATAEALGRWHLHCDFMPTLFNGAALADTLPASPSSRVLWVRGRRAKESFREHLRQRSIQLDEVITYESHDVTELNPGITEILQHGQIHWLTLTSPAIARSSAALLGEYFQKIPIAALSPDIAQEAAQYGGNVAAIAPEATLESLATAMANAETLQR